MLDPLPILAVWTALAGLWWLAATALLAASRRRHPPAVPGDHRGITVFKALPTELGRDELERVLPALASWAAELDAASEMLVGCHERDRATVAARLEELLARHPRAEVRLVAHPDPAAAFPNPKVSWMRILADHAGGQLWLWSDADVVAPPGTLAALRADYAAAGEGMVTSPYAIAAPDHPAGLLDALFVNAEMAPGIELLARLGRIRFGFGSAMLFAAAPFHLRIDWRELGSHLADDYELGRRLGPVRLGSVRLFTTPADRRWRGALLHYLRWQRTIRWNRPASYAAQLVIVPLLGWLGWIAVAPTAARAWAGLGATLALEATAALATCAAIRCPLPPRLWPALPLWSLARASAWLAAWLPLPAVWRGTRWWRARQPVDGARHAGDGR